MALLRFSTLVLLLFITSEISPCSINSHNFEHSLQTEKGLNADKEYNLLINSLLRQHENEDKTVEMDLKNVLKDPKYILEKRNGDLINFLLGLPKEMLDAGR